MYSRRYARGCVTYLIVFLLVVPTAAICMCLPLFFFQSNPNASAFWLIGPMMIWFMGMVGGVLAFGVGTTVIRRRWQDAALEPLGLSGERYALTGRKYIGHFNGRTLEVSILRGPMIDFKLQASSPHQFSISKGAKLTRVLAPVFGREPLQLIDPLVQGLSIFANDAGWMSRFLARQEVRDSLPRLIHAEGPEATRQILVQDGELWLRLYENKNLFRYEFSAEDAHRWVDDLSVLASAAEQSK